MSMHVAMKCAWNDAGYKAQCSDCPNTNPSCSDRAIHITPKECWERHLLSDYEFGVGENRHILKTAEGKLAIFTTIKPPFDHRCVLAISKISEVDRGRNNPPYGPYPASWSDMLHIDPQLTVVVPNNIDINFKTYYPTPWNQGLYRYITDAQVRSVLMQTKLELQKRSVKLSELNKIDELTKSLK